MAKVSIIVPVYNTEKYLVRCINSLLSQTLDGIELIFVDDVSTDKSFEILKMYEKTHPERIKVFRNEKNSGTAYSRNVGLRYAKGDYIGFVDSDDYIEPDMFKLMYETAKKDNLDVVTVNMNIVYHNIDCSFLSSRRACSETDKKKFFTATNPSCCNKLFKSSLLKDKKFKDGIKWEDFPFTLSAISDTDSFKCLSDNMYHYRININGTTCTDLMKVHPKMLDIFTCCDLLEEEMKRNGSYSELEQELRDVQIINSVSRIRDLFFVPLPYLEKKELVNLISKLIKIKYGDWQQNEHYLSVKKNAKFFKMRMQSIEKTYVDDSVITTNDEVKIKKKIKEIITK